MKKKKKNVNAAILIIGNEILSGRTQDKNIAFISHWLNTKCGILVKEMPRRFRLTRFCVRDATTHRAPSLRQQTRFGVRDPHASPISCLAAAPQRVVVATYHLLSWWRHVLLVADRGGNKVAGALRPRASFKCRQTFQH